MDRPVGQGALLRFVLGTAASVVAGFVLFRGEVWNPDGPWFQCITVGALVAGAIALMRVGRTSEALSLSTAFALVHIGYAWTLPPARAVAESMWGIVLAGGVFLSAVIFHRLAEEGYRFGKFVLLGPLVAGVYMAATALILVGRGRQEDATGLLVQYVFVGLVLGDAVGLGVELAEIVPSVGGERPRTPRGRPEGQWSA